MNRRNLLKAAVWSAPSIAVSASAPAYATSTPSKPECKVSGKRENCSKHYEYTVTVGCVTIVKSVQFDGKKMSRNKKGQWVLQQSKKVSQAVITVVTSSGVEQKVVRFK